MLAIVSHALAWERCLMAQGELNDAGSSLRQAISA